MHPCVRGFTIGLFGSTALAADMVTVPGPAGSGSFGQSVTVLRNGHFVVIDPNFDAPGPVNDVGAVRLYDATGVLISTLRGSTAGNLVGSSGITVLANGHFVVKSPNWDALGAINAGATTFCRSDTGCEGIVSAANSLIGTSPGGAGISVVALADGDYVVVNDGWDHGAIQNVGAVTRAPGDVGLSGTISATNSLIGAQADDRIGERGVFVLPDGNLVISSRFWDNGGIADAGAVTWMSGSAPLIGTVTPANSLVGTSLQDHVGTNIVPLANGNYLVSSGEWDNGGIADAGAVTLGSGSAGVSGVVSAANSLVGSSTDERVGFFNGPVALSNGNYVVCTPRWDNGSLQDVGAATFGSGTSGIVGTVSPANSLVGTTPQDQVCLGGITALADGDYVVASPFWDNGAVAGAGAATLASGSTGLSGVVSSANSLVGSSENDRVGDFVLPLANGGFVVFSPGWRNGAIASAGAATFGSADAAIAGPVSALNSLVGTTPDDQVGVNVGGLGLTDGGYVVCSARWDDGAFADVGAVTFGPGGSGIQGPVSTLNSLVGTTPGDFLCQGLTALPGNAVLVRSPNWQNAGVRVGAFTLVRDGVGTTGTVSGSNSLIGVTASDGSNSTVTALPNGNYVLSLPNFDHAGATDVGAITLGLRDGSVTGLISPQNSVIGSVASGGSRQRFDYDPDRNQLVVGQPASNRVVLFRTGIATVTNIVADSPDASFDGQSVNLRATVVSASAPNDGQVIFSANDGTTCSASVPAVTSPTTTDFSCTVRFDQPGMYAIRAEYRGSFVRAWSRSTAESHLVLRREVFGDGFE
jgi:hypothetical protein